MLKIKEAKEEIEKKSYLEIQKETAWKWASRAAAAFELSIEEKDLKRKVAQYQVAQEFEHEALEHAALYEDSGKLLVQVSKELDPHREKAAEDLQDNLK